MPGVGRSSGPKKERRTWRRSGRVAWITSVAIAAVDAAVDVDAALDIGGRVAHLEAVVDPPWCTLRGSSNDAGQLLLMI